jgi:hypothetical protein
MTSHGSASGRFTRAIQRRNVLGAEMAMRELGDVPLSLALDYVALVAEVQPHRLDRTAVRWHGRLELEAPLLTLSEAQLALAALADLRGGSIDSLRLLKALLRRTGPVLGAPRRSASTRGS